MPRSPERSGSEPPAVSAARELVVELRSAIDDPEGIKATLLELAQGDDGARVKEFLEGQLKLELLDQQPASSDRRASQLRRGSALFLAEKGGHADVVELVNSARDEPRQLDGQGGPSSSSSGSSGGGGGSTSLSSN